MDKIMNELMSKSLLTVMEVGDEIMVRQETLHIGICDYLASRLVSE